MSNTNERLVKIEAVRDQYRRDLDVAISALDADAWDEGYAAGHAAVRAGFVSVLQAQGVAQEIIDALPDDPDAEIAQKPLTVAEYVGHALKTENIDFEGIRSRLENAGIWHFLRLALRAQIQVGGVMEAIKKHIFYGKPLGNVTAATWPLQSAEAQLREERSGEGYHDAPEFGDPRILRLLHALTGIVSEAGELAGPVFAHVFGTLDLDVSNLEEEVGDNQWYIAVLSDALRSFEGNGLEGIMYGNVAKLKARYKGKGFSEQHAMQRDTAAEDKAREGAGQAT